MLSRRYFLRSSAIAVAGFGAAPSWLLNAAAQGQGRRKILISIFQRGAADGLNIVVPYFEKAYYDLRPGIAVPAPGKTNGAIDLDGRFGLHPSLQQLKPLWDAGNLAIVEAAGSPDPTRSHFDAQDYMESGTPGRTTADGWLNRALLFREAGSSPVRAIAMGAQLPRTLRGKHAAVAINNLEQFQVRNSNAAGILESMYAATSDAALKNSGKETFEAVKIIESLNRSQMGGSLAAFSRDMGDRMADIVMVTMSEFGRTAKEDGNAGTDHGHGNLMMVLGGPVRGGKIYGRWPGLQPDQLYEQRDLAVTTDFRDVLGELIRAHYGQNNTAAFPGHEASPPLGLL